jgi:uncharacterized protein YcsI (UPF0317 family)
MRPYKIAYAEEVRRITRGFPKQEREPIICGWEWAVTLGIYEKVKGGNVDFGDRVGIDDVNGKILHTGPAGSRVTAMASRLEGITVSPRPGCMFVGDVPADDKSA